MKPKQEFPKPVFYMLPQLPYHLVPPRPTRMFSPPEPESPKRSLSPVSSLLRSAVSYDGNIMLAAVISLLLVLLFVLLLHVYAKWFLEHTRRRSSTGTSASVLGAARFHHFNTLTFDTSLSSSPSKGLEASAIAALPVFVYKPDEHKHGLECVICLTVFEEKEVGRKLPKCGHAFHVECIDMWLHSHSSCPICRAPAGMAGENKIVEMNSMQESGRPENDGESVLEIVVEVPSPGRGENESETVGVSDSLSACSSSSSLSSQAAALGGSLKRMLSRNRSEHKVHPSANANEFSED